MITDCSSIECDSGTIMSFSRDNGTTEVNLGLVVTCTVLGGMGRRKYRSGDSDAILDTIQYAAE